MAATELHFNVGDRGAPIRLELLERDGSVKDISSHTVVFNMYLASTEVQKVTNGACTLTNSGTDGKAHYPWTANDINTAGTYWGYFKATIGGLDVQYPQNGKNLKIIIHSTP